MSYRDAVTDETKTLRGFMEDKKANEDKIVIEYKGYKNQEVTIKDIPEGMKLVADLCGLDVAVSLLQNMKGITISVPSNGFEKIEKKIILQEYDGTTITLRKLALNLDLNEKTVRSILNNYGLETTNGQLHLFEKGWQNRVKSV